jgi:hypothetical protein
MDRLIFLINDFNSVNIDPTPYLSPDHPTVSEVTVLADKYLITDKGHCNWENINILRNKGIDVFPVERDSFGWILGGILTSKGIIVYG